MSRRLARVLVVVMFVSSVFAVAQQKPAGQKQQPPPSQAPSKAAQPPTSPAPPADPNAGAAATTEVKEDPKWRGLNWRLIGPFRGGRAIAVSGVVDDPLTYYFGAVAGGVWKTTDAGLNWKPIADKAKITSVGSLAVAESDSNVIYVGTGEACIRGNIVEGDGVYKSIDAGKTWNHIGLRETRHIGKVIVHPKNPDVVFVAALGNAYAPNPERGLFRSTDGGKNWQRVLFRDENTGAIDVTFDPTNANTMFAAMWQAHRKPWLMESGGPGSGLYKSTDAGATWKRLEGNGLPKGILGRIGVSVSAANPQRVYALIEAKEGGLFRSDDGGENWRRTTNDARFTQRAWYYTHVQADPQSADTVYILNVGLHRSNDGGRTFSNISAPHSDHHGLWIDPKNSKRMINANDGGANVSFNAGQSWTGQDNQPTAQFYHVSTDNAFPYRVYGAQQDNSTVSVASRGDGSSIGRADWYEVGGCESGYIAPDPRDNNVVYAGCYGGHITRLDRRTGQEQEINAWPLNPIGAGAGQLKHRFQWTAPIVISHHNPDVVYHAAEVLFRTTNGGQSWTAISPDLTRNDKAKQASSGGPLTKDNTSVEYFNTIFTVAESPKQKGLIWAGTDDGLIHITRDDGANWTNVTPREMPEWGTVSLIEASPHEAGVAYAAVKRHRLSDFQPYIFKTADFGKTWTRINRGIPNNVWVHAVREDAKKRGLLVAGTEVGVYVSFNDGADWEFLQTNLPQVQIADIVIKDNDLVVGTHGRSFWILDDIAPLRQHKADLLSAEFALYAPSAAWRVRGGGGFGAPANAGQNPPPGAVIYYRLKQDLDGDKDAEKKEAAAKEGEADAKAAAPAQKPSPITIEILDASGKVIRKYPAPPQPQEPGADDEGGPPQQAQRIPAKAGLNRFVWNLRYEDVPRIPGSPMWGGSTRGPVALPGKYQVRLTVNGKSQVAPLELQMDPRVKTPPADMARQFEMLTRIQQRVGEAHKAVNDMREVRRQLQDVTKRVKDTPQAKPITEAARQLEAKMKPVEETIVEVRNKSNQDALNYGIKLNNQLAALFSVIESADTAPTQQSLQLFELLNKQLEEQLGKWQQIRTTDVAQFNELVQKQQVPAVILSAPAGTQAAPAGQ